MGGITALGILIFPAANYYGLEESAVTPYKQPKKLRVKYYCVYYSLTTFRFRFKKMAVKLTINRLRSQASSDASGLPDYLLVPYLPPCMSRCCPRERMTCRSESLVSAALSVTSGSIQRTPSNIPQVFISTWLELV